MNLIKATPRQWIKAGLLASLGLLLPLGAEAALPGMLNSIPTSGGGQSYSFNIELLVFLTSLTFLPAVVLMMTSFTRIIIVLSMFRMAIGTQSSPPNQVLIGLALFLTLFVMSPVLDKIYTEAYIPLSEDKITLMAAMEKGGEPLKDFMLRQTRQADLAMYLKLANAPAVQSSAEIPFRVLVPAFVTSELKTAFQISFAIFIPFIIIDMVVASILMAMGMMMVSPAIVSLPFKIMLFVLVDGWQLLLSSLGGSFG